MKISRLYILVLTVIFCSYHAYADRGMDTFDFEVSEGMANYLLDLNVLRLSSSAREFWYRYFKPILPNARVYKEILVYNLPDYLQVGRLKNFIPMEDIDPESLLDIAYPDSSSQIKVDFLEN